VTRTPDQTAGSGNLNTGGRWTRRAEEAIDVGLNDRGDA
jgi:hypothetical protein